MNNKIKNAIAKELANEIAYHVVVSGYDFAHAWDQMNHAVTANVVAVKAGCKNADVDAFVAQFDDSSEVQAEWEAAYEAEAAFTRKVKRRIAELRKAYGR